MFFIFIVLVLFLSNICFGAPTTGYKIGGKFLNNEKNENIKNQKNNNFNNQLLYWSNFNFNFFHFFIDKCVSGNPSEFNGPDNAGSKYPY